ncbi:DEAD/DEAH box helicase family protein [Rheinheimera sp. MM224]|uniref:DEAD/DEAH box helicase family protein n=1 Tax=Rheinheimera sp. MM224 TaxID=3019969 RepID=UPI0021F85F09|nr:DEAD/DEAH box helicase family protein [Rheinheimera sp. MM224]CAI3798206.1 hypothetical protein JAMGFMIE_02013 [Rheinheimera sp. MM224]
MNEKAVKHRHLVQQVLNSDSLFQHQRTAAQKTFDALQGEVRAVVTAAEMQAGKSGVALALACLQRLSLSDEDICDKAKLKDTLYLVTMPDIALIDQAEKDLANAKNIIVSNFVRFEQDIERNFKGYPPKLILIDECHYGSNASSIRYCQIFDYLEKQNDSCKVVFISATPFGALYAAEQEYEVAKHLESLALRENDKAALKEAQEIAENAAKNSILRRDFKTKLVFHRTSQDYFGVRQMLAAKQIRNLDTTTRNFLETSTARDQFMDLFHKYEGAGWALVRVNPNNAMNAKMELIERGVSAANIFILGSQLNDVPVEELTSIDRFKREFDECIDFDEKLIAITVAGCRAGINFGQMMKTRLIATWDNTVTSIASVVQANVGRACGYHPNRDAIHFTNLNAAQAYGAILDYLDQNTAEHAASDFDGLREFFDEICQEYNVNGLDVGLTIKAKRRRPIGDVETYMTDSYIAVPGKLLEPAYDYSQHTSDPLLIKSIETIREEMTKAGGPTVKGNRAMRGANKNWVKAQWVNGDSYDNPEKARKEGTMKERTLSFTRSIDQGENIEFNQIVLPGSGEYSENKLITATIFSVYNISRRDGVKKKIMSLDDVYEMCDHFSVPRDDTMFVLYKRGEYHAERTRIKIESNEGPDQVNTIRDESQFSEKERNR